MFPSTIYRDRAWSPLRIPTSNWSSARLILAQLVHGVSEGKNGPFKRAGNKPRASRSPIGQADGWQISYAVPVKKFFCGLVKLGSARMAGLSTPERNADLKSFQSSNADTMPIANRVSFDGITIARSTGSRSLLCWLC